MIASEQRERTERVRIIETHHPDQAVAGGVIWMFLVAGDHRLANRCVSWHAGCSIACPVDRFAPVYCYLALRCRAKVFKLIGRHASQP